VLKELSTLDEVHDEVDPVRLLEDVVHANYERVIYLIQNELFNLERLHRFVLDDYILSDDFHSIQFVLALVTDQVNFAKSASSNNANELEIIPGHLG